LITDAMSFGDGGVAVAAAIIDLIAHCVAIPIFPLIHDEFASDSHNFDVFTISTWSISVVFKLPLCMSAGTGMQDGWGSVVAVWDIVILSVSLGWTFEEDLVEGGSCAEKTTIIQGTADYVGGVAGFVGMIENPKAKAITVAMLVIKNILSLTVAIMISDDFECF